MSYKRILPADIFVWYALPDTMRHRVHRLPAGFPVSIPPPTGFPVIDARQAEESVRNGLATIAAYPERRASGCEFLDELAKLIHRNGLQTTRTYAYWMDTSKDAFCGAVQALSGISAQKWVNAYTMLAVNDIRRRTDLKLHEIGDLLFPLVRNTQGVSQYIKRNGG